ncbi:DASH complex subunit Dad4 [Jimgerdemannia flammicorona]|uniref:DASH complex subunit DAD4 n=1 Tax=Jimgerdemannia flammicorona TaxID=994334 RepID=A0A433QNW8_9FUNG|nr:DASH complex subunit Dad4 [Jimgerdemannia flammicorona]
MENPHEEQQNALLNRIIVNVQKLNDVVTEMTDRLQEINEHNRDIALIAQMWGNYNRSVLVQLESTQTLADPI